MRMAETNMERLFTSCIPGRRDGLLRGFLAWVFPVGFGLGLGILAFLSFGTLGVGFEFGMSQFLFFFFLFFLLFLAALFAAVLVRPHFFSSGRRIGHVLAR